MATVLLRCYWKQRERKAREAIVPAEPCPSLPSLKSCVAAVWDLDTANTSIRMRAQAGDGRPCVLNSDESVSRIWTVARALGTMRVQIHVMQSLSAKPVVPSTPKVSTPLRRVKNVQNLRAVFGQVSFRCVLACRLGGKSGYCGHGTLLGTPSFSVPDVLLSMAGTKSAKRLVTVGMQ